jgi:hypothetical protein
MLLRGTQAIPWARCAELQMSDGRPAGPWCGRMRSYALP